MASNLFGQRPPPLEESYRERETTFELYLHQCITRCNWEDWKAQKGWIKSSLERGLHIAATRSLLNLANEIYEYDDSFIETKLINDLKDGFYGKESTMVEGFPSEPVLASLERNPIQDIKTLTEFEIAGFQTKDKTIILKLPYNRYMTLYNAATRDLFGIGKPFNALLTIITKLLNNRYSSFTDSIKIIIQQINDLFSFKDFNEIIDIIDDVKLKKIEEDFYNIEKDDKETDIWTPQHEKPEKTSMPKLTNNPFYACEVFTGMSINVSDLAKRFLHLEQVTSFGKLGLRTIIYKKIEKEDVKVWLTIKFKEKLIRDDKEIDFDLEPFWKLSSYYHVINDLLNKTDVIEEQKSLMETKVNLIACMRRTSSIIYAIITYMLGFKPVRKGGRDFTDDGTPSLD